MKKEEIDFGRTMEQSDDAKVIRCEHPVKNTYERYFAAAIDDAILRNDEEGLKTIRQMIFYALCNPCGSNIAPLAPMLEKIARAIDLIKDRREEDRQMRKDLEDLDEEVKLRKIVREDFLHRMRQASETGWDGQSSNEDSSLCSFPCLDVDKVYSQLSDAQKKEYQEAESLLEGVREASSTATKTHAEPPVHCFADMINPQMMERYRSYYEREIAPHLLHAEPSCDPFEVVDMEFAYVKESYKTVRAFKKGDVYNIFSVISNYLKCEYTKQQLAEYMSRHIAGMPSNIESIRRRI